MLYLNIGIPIVLIVMGINDYFSERPLSGQYWATLIIFLGILPCTLHIQFKKRYHSSIHFKMIQE